MLVRPVRIGPRWALAILERTKVGRSGPDMVLSMVRPQKFLANLVILAERLRTAAVLGELFRPSGHRLIIFISFDTSPCHWHILAHGEP
jgi:hypothetical protein